MKTQEEVREEIKQLEKVRLGKKTMLQENVESARAARWALRWVLGEVGEPSIVLFSSKYLGSQR